MSNRPIFFQETEPSARKHRSSKRSKRWFAGLVLFAVVLVSAVLVAELATRFIWGRSVVLFPVFNTEVTYGPYQLRRLEPSFKFRHTSADGTWHFATNAQGFRDSYDYKYEKAPGARRILCLGDSQTLGFEARQERIFPTVIEQRLRRLGHNVEVLNTAVPGFGTAEEFAFFENEGLKYKPDVVVLGWHISDFAENEASGLFQLRDSVLSSRKYQYTPGLGTIQLANSILGLEWTSQNSYLYSFVFNRVSETRKQILLQKNANAKAAAGDVRHQGAEISAYQVELSVALVKRLHELCKKHGARLLIVDIPWLPLDNTGFAPSLPAVLANRFEQNSDEVLQANEVLGAYRGATDIFLPHGEHHISETSHLLIGMTAAQKIANWLTEVQPQ